MYAHIQSIEFDPDMYLFPVQEAQDLNSMNGKMRLKVKVYIYIIYLDV